MRAGMLNTDSYWMDDRIVIIKPRRRRSDGIVVEPNGIHFDVNAYRVIGRQGVAWWWNHHG